MAVKAKLRIVLHAGDVVVAESEDSQLWQKVLAAINTPGEGAPVGDRMLDVNNSLGFEGSDAIGKFAQRLGVTKEQVVGACDPSTTPPFIHLDEHHWEDLKKNTPARGPNSLSATVMALTLLVLWKDSAGLEQATPKEASGVRESIGIDDKNPARSLKNCEWLQERNGSVRLNPTQTSKATAVARAYCARTAPGAST